MLGQKMLGSHCEGPASAYTVNTHYSQEELLADKYDSLADILEVLEEDDDAAGLLANIDYQYSAHLSDPRPLNNYMSRGIGDDPDLAGRHPFSLPSSHYSSTSEAQNKKMRLSTIYSQLSKMIWESEARTLQESSSSCNQDTFNLMKKKKWESMSTQRSADPTIFVDNLDRKADNHRISHRSPHSPYDYCINTKTDNNRMSHISPPPLSGCCMDTATDNDKASHKSPPSPYEYGQYQSNRTSACKKDQAYACTRVTASSPQKFKAPVNGAFPQYDKSCKSGLVEAGYHVGGTFLSDKNIPEGRPTQDFEQYQKRKAKGEYLDHQNRRNRCRNSVINSSESTAKVDNDSSFCDMHDMQPDTLISQKTMSVATLDTGHLRPGMNAGCKVQKAKINTNKVSKIASRVQLHKLQTRDVDLGELIQSPISQHKGSKESVTNFSPDLEGADVADIRSKTIDYGDDGEVCSYVNDVNQYVLWSMENYKQAAKGRLGKEMDNHKSAPAMANNTMVSVHIIACMQESPALRRFMEREKMKTKREVVDVDDKNVDAQEIKASTDKSSEVELGKPATMSSLEVENGLSLISLMLLCASAVEKEEMMGAVMVLGELSKRIAAPGSDTTDTSMTTMQRLGLYFCEALATHLVQRPSAAYNHLMRLDNLHLHSRSSYELDNITYQSPIFQFGHIVANQVIVEAVEHLTEEIHIVDVRSCGLTGVINGDHQWDALVGLLALAKAGPPRAVHITTLVIDHDHEEDYGGCCNNSYDDHSHGELRLKAQMLGIKLRVDHIEAGEDDELDHLIKQVQTRQHRCALARRPEAYAVVLNCTTAMATCSSKEKLSQIAGTLGSVIWRGLIPTVVVLVEQELKLHGISSFVGCFVEAFHYYAAVFDAIDAASTVTQPHDRKALVADQQLLIAPHIKEAIARASRDGKASPLEDIFPSSPTVLHLQQAGFARSDLSLTAIAQTKQLLLLYQSQAGRSGFHLIRHQTGSLSLAWKDKSLVTASAWIPHSPPSDAFNFRH